MTQTTQSSNHDVIDLLATDHREALDLITQIRRTTDQDRQRDLADVLIAEIVRHAVSEELVVYPAMREYLPEGDNAVDHDIREHKEIESTLKDLEAADPTVGSFIACVERVETQLRHHAEDEENDQFPRLRSTVPADQLVTMAQKVEAVKKVAPTRPHPSSPNDPLFHMVAGPGVGLVDRIRDRLSHRPTDPDQL